ncbi:MAG: flagellar hook protein FlgE [Leptospirales bacterium]|nr:flagellar hook protein FlgE [Leptospirales bacterium]HMW60264.1 flagellar hook protein FlgE [Leptospiraceae bacterium]HMZ37063.1 flagellar hook protein FlgE [Leptospiraceae bacterium]HNE25153.1 flagellar hook protein FlgE [Leptospiraceae bacterium]HNL02738.1 flagellar hook protein FlgE [Leptospiraceae bacterium]
MMRSLYSGVAGMKNHQTRMDVIGNNVSNVNTHGFKTERVTFMDMISQEISGAAEPRENVGGINPQQVGLGMMIASIDKIMTQGSLQTTGKNTDVAISGDGFFVVRDGGKQYYTRAGIFSMDRDGFYVHPGTGLRVQGWNARQDRDGNSYINSAAGVEDIRIPLYQKKPAKATSEVVFESNLNQAVQSVPADATEEQIQQFLSGPQETRRGHVATANVYDEEGNKRELRLEFYKTGDNRWQVRANMENSSNLSVNVVGPGGQDTAVGGTNAFELGFASDGRVQSVSDGVDTQNSGKLTVNVSFRIPGNPAVQTIKLNMGEAGAVKGVTQFASSFTTHAKEQDGYPMGYLESFSIDNTGSIVGTYTNGVKEPLAKVALATFTNPAGLTKEGETKFSESMNSGNANVGEAGIGGRGKMFAGVLEMSNVDLSDQFTDMIVTQRGFQANSRTITTSDQMIQEILGLKR